MPDQPTILVKKTDGTQVRMTMAEFKEYKEGLQTSKPASPQAPKKGVVEESSQTEEIRDEEVENEKTPETVSMTEEKTEEKNETELHFSEEQNFAKDGKKEVVGVAEIREKLRRQKISEPQTPIIEPELRTPIIEPQGEPKPKPEPELKSESRIPIDESAISNQQSAIDESQAQVIQSSSKSRKLKAESDAEDLPMIESPHELATTTPVKDIFIDEAISESRGQKWTKEDHKSLLEDEVGELKQHGHLETLPDRKDSLFAEVLKKIKFAVPDDLQARLQSLITSRVKEIRTDEQLLDYITRPAVSGGLGLDSGQAEELLEIIKEVWHLSKEKKKIISQTDNVEKATKPAIAGINKSRSSEMSLPRLPGEQKQVLHDIVKIKSDTKIDNKEVAETFQVETVGAIDEIKSFSLVDLRRLGNSPDECFKRLVEKFENIKSDSIILYLQAVQVWQDSPLYHQYQGMVHQAITEKASLKDLATGKDNLTWEEVEGIVAFQDDLI